MYLTCSIPLFVAVVPLFLRYWCCSVAPNVSYGAELVRFSAYPSPLEADAKALPDAHESVGAEHRQPFVVIIGQGQDERQRSRQERLQNETRKVDDGGREGQGSIVEEEG